MSSIPLDLSRANCRRLHHGQVGECEHGGGVDTASSDRVTDTAFKKLNRGSRPGAMGDTDIVSSQLGN